MRISIVCFTDCGYGLGEKIMESLRRAGDDAELTRSGKGYVSLKEWVESRFFQRDGLVFIGAAGIAVRGIAPLLISKTTDPAVVVLDETGRFAISLLSGHIGGGNQLATRIAQMVGATPVVTTATDLHGTFAVDNWAVIQGLAIGNPAGIKAVSSRLLAGETVGVYSDFPLTGKMPQGMVLSKTAGESGLCISIYQPLEQETTTLYLVPPAGVLGIGCRKNTPIEKIETAFASFCDEGKISPKSIGRVCSIDLKKDELGIIQFCAKRKLDFITYTPQELNGVAGDFSGSDFVKRTTGVDNVCERSALLGCGTLSAPPSKLVVKKQVYDGITLALAVREYPLRW